MVMILEPREVIPHEAVPALDTKPHRTARTYELSYSVPCAGVKLYSFRPAGEPRPAPEFLPVKLIDEKVYLL